MTNGEWGMGNGECRKAGSLPVIPRSPFPTPHSIRHAFTLLEVLLTLLIATILIAAMSAAVNTHLRTVDAARGEVEQAQLARALLRRIADDLRAAIPYPLDESTSATAVEAADAVNLANAAASATGGGTTSGNTSGGGSSKSGSSTGSSSAGVGSGTKLTTLSTLSKLTAQTPQKASSSGGTTSSGGGSSSGSTPSTAAEPSAEETPLPAGFLGTQYDLQLEIARLPNPNQSAAPIGVGATPALSSLNPQSDVRTVSYYVSTSAAASAVGLAPNDPMNQAASGGLFRSEIDRAAARFAGTSGVAATGNQAQRLLAPEVTGLSFRYFDGTTWLTDWDSSVSTAIPRAVEVTIMLRSAVVPTSAWQLQSRSNVPTDQAYSLVVHLPASQTVASSESTETATTTTGATQ